MLRILHKLILAISVCSIIATPSQAMFIQPDWWDPSDPRVGTNRYAYSFNDPINNRDPNGNMSDVSPGDIIGGIVVVGIVATDALIDRWDDGKVNGSQGLGIANGAKELGLAGAGLFGGMSSAGVQVGDGTPAIPNTGVSVSGTMLSPESNPGGFTVSTPVNDGAISITVHESGSYTIDFPDGTRYHGKGPIDRARRSARQKAREKGYDLGQTDIDWSPSENDRDAFKDEDDRIQGDGGVENPSNHNKVNSPGKKYNEEDSNG
ncbi:hypothetical protein R0J92_20505 [Tritonibacter sp. SIMBA_163]